MTKHEPVWAADKTARAKILVVDDDERNLLALSEVLSGIAEVVVAPSGRDALRLLLKNDFAVILLDVFMPGMDGYETAALIRQREQTARVPIIFLSAVNKETEHLMRGYEMGAVDYVFKPVDPLVLQSKVAVFVDLYRMRCEIERNAMLEQQLLDTALKAKAEKLRVEQELRLSEQRQALIIESLPIVLYMEQIDAEPRVPQFVAGNFAALTGYRFEELAANPDLWSERLHPEDRDRTLAGLERRRAMQEVTLEYRWQCADGQWKHFLDQGVMLRDGEGSPGTIAGTLLDITERKALEAQLTHSQKMDAIGKLTGGIAHDFNNLLAAVLGGLTVLERRLELGEREKFVVDQMRHAAERGADLVRRMMAFARQQDLVPASVDPRSLCQSVAGLVSHTLGGKTTIDWHCPDKRLNLFIDRSQLELAMMNLILNARDAMPNGGRIAISIEPCPPDEAPPGPRLHDRHLRIRVADEGHGMTPDLVAKITEPFFTTKEVGKGTGLGLSMVAGFVHQSGGELRIESAVGAGTTIDMILPATMADTVEDSATADSGSARMFANKRVLLIDDDEAVRVVLREQLRDLDIEVDDYSSGTAAIEALTRGDTGYDYVLSDFAMPGLDGAETLKRMRDLLPAAKVALMTGYADEKMLGKVKTSIPVIRKPLDVDKMASAFQV